MLNFCTLFDSFYLSRGLMMYESLKEHTKNFHLYIFTFDQLSNDILNNLKLEKVTVISLSDFENDELLKVKTKRSKAEYCWTCTPSTIHYILENYDVLNCTYIDADLFFYRSPEILIQEMYDAGKNVLITEHRYNKLAKIRDKERAGKFCVQFITFTNDEDSKEVLNEWKDKCIDSCYAKYEDGKFGDQKYLDEWPGKYENIHILENLGGGVAPWNVAQYKMKSKRNALVSKNKRIPQEFDLVFYHFHFIRFINSMKVDIGWNYLPRFAIKNIYKPYITSLVNQERRLELLDSGYIWSFYKNTSKGPREIVKYLIKKFTGFNILKIKNY